MQYPPQEPLRQSAYVRGQSQYQPPQSDQGIERRSSPGQMLAIFPNRGQAIWRTVVIAIYLVFLVAMDIFFLFLTFSVGSSDPSVFPIFLSLFVFLAALTVFFGWMTWRMAYDLLFSGKPLLTFNREGITVGSIPFYSGFFLPWSEIEAIYVYTFMYKYLCFRARNQSQYMKRFNIFERFFRYSNIITGVPPLVMPQIYLERPIQEILYLMFERYQAELNYYGIRHHS
jgi:hypothetical protein